MMNSIRGNAHEGHLVDYTKTLVSSGALEDETGVSTGWRRHGGLSITNNEDQLREFRFEYHSELCTRLHVFFQNVDNLGKIHGLGLQNSRPPRDQIPPSTD